MSLITIPNRPVGTDERSIEDILANFDAITTVVNGDLDSTNFTNLALSTYTPALGAGTTAPVKGNSSVIGKYLQLGKLCWFQIWYQVGSTFTTVGCTGAYSLTLPFTGAADGSTTLIPAYVHDGGTGVSWTGMAYTANSNAFNIYLPTSSSDTRLQPLSVSSPGTGSNPLVSGSTIDVNGWYRTV